MLVLAPRLSQPFPLRLHSAFPPGPDRNVQDVDDVEADHEESFPQVDVRIVQDAECEKDGDAEEADVAEEGSSSDAERLDERHRTAAIRVSVLRCFVASKRQEASTHATTETMKLAAPINSPMAKLPESLLRAANVEKTSGLPLEKARKVTPACEGSVNRPAPPSE